MVYSFSKVGKLAQPKKPKRKAQKPPPMTPNHNFADVAEAVMTIAKIIDPRAFDELQHPDLRIARRRAIAMQKARDAVAAYDRILGNQRHVRMIVQKHGRTRFYTITRGSKPQR